MNVFSQTIEKDSLLMLNNYAMASIKDNGLKKMLKSFANDMCSFNFDKIHSYIDEEHYNAQIKMYLNDNFMFKSLGKPGHRDTSMVKVFYLRETLGLSEIEFNNLLNKNHINNFYSLKDMKSIRQFYYAPPEIGEYIKVQFVAITKDRKMYCGKMWLHPNTYKIFGSWG